MRVAAKAFPNASLGVQLCAGVLAVWWAGTAIFYALAFTGGFRLLVALPLVMLVTGLAYRRHSDDPPLLASASRDLQGVCKAWRELGRPERWVVSVFGLVLGFTNLRGLVSPPLTWDALTYHLVHASRWVHGGGFAREIAPGNWSFYEFFPIGGEILWGWAMLPMGSDALLAPAGVAVVLVVVLATYTCARMLDVERNVALLVGVTVASAPAAAAFATSAYVDNQVLALTALGTVFLLREGRTPAQANRLWAAGAFGLSAGVKLPAAVLCLAAGVALLVLTVRSDSRALCVTKRLGALLLPAAIGLPHWIRTAHATGSAFFPFEVDLPGVPVLAGSAQFLAFHSASIVPPHDLQTPALTLLGRMMGWAPPWNMNFGPAGYVIAGLGVIGLVSMLRRTEQRVGAVFLISIVGIMAAIASSDMAVVTRSFTWPVAGRFFTPGLLALALGASLLAASRLIWLWCVLALVSLWVARPWSSSPAQLQAMLIVLGAAAVAAVVCQGWFRYRAAHGSTGSAWLSAVVVASLVFALGAVLAGVRASYRTPIYGEAARGTAVDVAPLHGGFASSWPIWADLDRRPPERIAVATGWGGLLHNGYRSPLFGARLQHTLVTVPTSRSGEVIDTLRFEDRLREADPNAWIARLVDLDITMLVTLQPNTTLESAWARERPELFKPLVRSVNRNSASYRFDADSAARWLERRSSHPVGP